VFFTRRPLGVFSPVEVEEKVEEIFLGWQYGSLLEMCVSLGKGNGGSHGDFSCFYECGVEYRWRQSKDATCEYYSLTRSAEKTHPMLRKRKTTQDKLMKHLSYLIWCWSIIAFVWPRD
jgi:hypothetical protein